MPWGFSPKSRGSKGVVDEGFQFRFPGFRAWGLVFGTQPVGLPLKGPYRTPERNPYASLLGFGFGFRV